MYTKTLSYGIRWGHSGRGQQEVSESEDQWSCVEAYLLGDFLDDVEFRKAVLNKLVFDIARWKTHFSAALVTRVWTKTPAGSVFRTFVLQLMVASVMTPRQTTALMQGPSRDNRAQVM
jgi:hypothetical protein